jgi:hypothetical protein
VVPVTVGLKAPASHDVFELNQPEEGDRGCHIKSLHSIKVDKDNKHNHITFLLLLSIFCMVLPGAA